MLIKYKIIQVTLADHSFVVRFYTDKITEEFLAIKNPDTGEIIRNPDNTIQACRTDYSITLYDVPTLAGEKLHEKIMSSAPVLWFSLQEKIIDPEVDTAMTELCSLVGVVSEGVGVIPEVVRPLVAQLPVTTP